MQGCAAQLDKWRSSFAGHKQTYPQSLVQQAHLAWLTALITQLLELLYSSARPCSSSRVIWGRRVLASCTS